MAITRSWNTFGSGNFNDANNWFPSGIPDVNDFVSFQVGSGNPYTVTFPGNEGVIGGGAPIANYTTSHLRVRDNGVTFSGSTQVGRGLSTYTLASTTQTEANRGIIIGVFGGENAELNVSHSSIVCCGGLSSFNGVAATLGDGAGASGTLNMNTGTFNVTGSDFTQTQLIIGNNGAGTLNVNNGADVNVPGSNSRTSLGHHSTGVGVVNISGAGSTWTSANELWIGENGSGTLTVQNGGSLITNGTGGTASTIIGTFSGGSGMATVTGVGSTWTNSSAFRVGNSGDGALTIAAGGQLIHNNFITPFDIGTGASGTATVTGAGSSLTTPGTIFVGSTGNGALGILNGGSVTSGRGQLRGLDAGSGEVLVSGAGSTWTVTNALVIGLPEAGFTTGPTTLTINPGATVSVAGDLDLNANSLLNLQGGTLAAGAINFVQGGGEFQWTSGTLHVTNYGGNLMNPGGTLAPGQSIGSTIVFGNYTQGADAAMEIEISNPIDPESFPERDFVSIDGAASLDGDLQLALIDGFVPTMQQTFAVFDAASLSGAFSNVAAGQRLTTVDGLGSFVVHYGPTSAFNPNQIVLSAFELAAGLPGDFNGNGAVENADLTLLLNHWGEPVPPTPAGWVGSPLTAPAVDNDELTALLNNWGSVAGTGASAAGIVPEPASTLLLLVALVTFGGTIRARRGPLRQREIVQRGMSSIASILW